MSDPLMDAINKASSAIDTSIRNTKKKIDQSAYVKFQKDANLFQRFVRTFIRASVWVYMNIFHPIWKWLVWKPIKYLFWKYVLLWNKVVYVKDEYGTVAPSKLRAIYMVIATMIGLYVAPATADFGIDAFILYPLTSSIHTVYMNGQEKVPDEPEVHEAGGCDENPGCSSAETSSYRIRSTPFNQFWSIVRFFKWNDPINLYYPDYVARAIPKQTAECVIHSYGFRQKFVNRNVYRTLDMYADILEVKSCKNISLE
jgi:hypothetical protein